MPKKKSVKKQSKKRTTKTKRDFWADALRVISIFMVVTIHTSAQVLYYWGEVSSFSWQFANILNSFSRISVPLFIMLSGAYLLNKKEDTQTFLKTRIPRIVLPWFVWGTIQLLIQNNFSLSIILSKGFASTLAENYLGAFWFMPMILGIYLLTPVIKPYIQKAKAYEWKYLLSGWILFASIIPTLNEVVGINISFSLPTWIQYLGYFVAGYYLTHVLKINEKLKKQIYGLFFMSIALIILGTTAFTLQNNSLFEGMYSYTNIFALSASLCGFIFFKDMFEKVTKRSFVYAKKFRSIKPKIEVISKASFGIFLSHALILELFTAGRLGFTFSSVSVHPLIALPTTTLLVFFSSLLVILGVKKFTPKLEKFLN
jgi:surface polysaccharide O-acyltransferase-like enzyme